MLESLESVKAYSRPQTGQLPCERPLHILREMKEELDPLGIRHREIRTKFLSQIPGSFFGTALQDKDILLNIAEEGMRSVYYRDLVGGGNEPELDAEVVIPSSVMFKRTDDLQTISFDFEILKEERDKVSDDFIAISDSE